MATEIINIDDHYGDAVDRLPEQYRNPPKIYTIIPEVGHSYSYVFAGEGVTVGTQDRIVSAGLGGFGYFLSFTMVTDENSVAFASELTSVLGAVGSTLRIVKPTFVNNAPVIVVTAIDAVPVQVDDTAGVTSILITLQAPAGTEYVTITQDGVEVGSGGIGTLNYQDTDLVDYNLNNPLGMTYTTLAATAATGWESLLHAFTKNAQTMEDIMQSMLDERGLNTSRGVNLDRIGQIVGEDRLGRTDEDYREAIISKIAENYSDGTEANIMATVKGLTEADSYLYTDMYDAKFRVDMINPTLPIGTRVLTGLNNAKVAGVGYQLLYAQTEYFRFDSDDAEDFGGYAVIGPAPYSFEFSSAALSSLDRIWVSEPLTSMEYNGVVENAAGNNTYNAHGEGVAQPMQVTKPYLQSVTSRSFTRNNATSNCNLTAYIYEDLATVERFSFVFQQSNILSEIGRVVAATVADATPYMGVIFTCLDNSSATALESELNAEMGTVGGIISIVDINGVEWSFTSATTGVNNVTTFSPSAPTKIVILRLYSYTVTKDGVASSAAEIDSDFGQVVYTDYAEYTAFNPLGPVRMGTKPYLAVSTNSISSTALQTGSDIGGIPANPQTWNFVSEQLNIGQTYYFVVLVTAHVAEGFKNVFDYDLGAVYPFGNSSFSISGGQWNNDNGRYLSLDVELSDEAVLYNTLNLQSENDETAGIFADELDAELGSPDGIMRLTDNSGVEWEITTLTGLTITEVDETVSLIEQIPLGETGGSDIVTITKDSVASSLSEIMSDFDGYTNLQEATYDTNNPLGVIGGVGLIDTEAGNYSTLLTGE